MDRVALWIQTIGAVGIIAGIVMVILQLEQNEQLLRLQLNKELVQAEGQTGELLLGDDSAEALARIYMDPGEATDADILKFDVYSFSLIQQWRARALLSREGLFDRPFELDGCFYFDHPLGRRYIEWFVQISANDAPVLAEIQRQLESCPEINSVAAYVKFMREAVEAEKAQR
ncbi:MAG TPA: hypothetical protein VLA56_00135 [Pseudomonadales bacterium]|nr:hypothetical protein [Pseudomonadales bacterium]